MDLGKLSVPGHSTDLHCSRALKLLLQGPFALAVGAGGVVWTFFSRLFLSLLSPHLWETA